MLVALLSMIAAMRGPRDDERKDGEEVASSFFSSELSASAAEKPSREEMVLVRDIRRLMLDVVGSGVAGLCEESCERTRTATYVSASTCKASNLLSTQEDSQRRTLHKGDFE